MPLADQKLPPIVSIAGRSRVGKTTFLVKLIAELSARGFRIGVVKHSVHSFVPSEPGRDTWKHAQAGAEAVAFASRDQLVISRSLRAEWTLDQIAASLGDVDLVLTEGYKQAHKPKIEVSRRERGTGLICRRSDIIAAVSDHPVDLDVPQFDLEDAAGVADLIEQRFLPRGPSAKKKGHPAVC
jgi:molybdopterin-guanine dinucleotide biosynthesis protein B